MLTILAPLHTVRNLQDHTREAYRALRAETQMTANQPFTRSERDSILREYFEGYKRYRFPNEEFSYRRGKLPALAKQYCDGVPILPLSRCPFCQSTTLLSLDHYDIDGLWWNTNFRLQQRPYHRETRCPHYYMLTGAMKLSEPIAYAPFLVETGPEIPFVVTKFFRMTMKAVLSQTRVGPHTAYLIVYYLDESNCPPGHSCYPDYRLWLPEWASDGAIRFHRGDMRANSEPASLPLYISKHADTCFDLTPCIEQGELLWIAPGDESMTLRSDVEGCPYLNLPGRREVAVIAGEGSKRVTWSYGLHRGLD